MASSYYIKLYHEILEDPKMMQLPDELFSLAIKLFLLAGDFESDGFLPEIEDMAWRLRIRVEDLELNLSRLEASSIVEIREEIWYVTKFSERQAPIEPTERWRRWKDRKRKDDYYQTGDNENANEPQTKRLTDNNRLNNNRLNKIKKDEIKKEKNIKPNIINNNNSIPKDSIEDGLLEALEKAGVVGNKKHALAGLEWVNVAYVKSLDRKLRKDKGRKYQPGLLIWAIEQKMGVNDDPIDDEAGRLRYADWED